MRELTPAELKVCTLLATGMSNKAIAETLDISLPAAKMHVHCILQKLAVSNRAQAALKLAAQPIASNPSIAQLLDAAAINLRNEGFVE